MNLANRLFIGTTSLAMYLAVFGTGCAASNPPPATPATTSANVSTVMDAPAPPLNQLKQADTTTVAPNGIVPNPSPTPPAAQAPLDDGQIAMIASDVDKAEIGAAKLALSQSHNPRVRQFAQHMVSAHTTGERKLQTLVHQDHLTLNDSPVSAKLTSDSSTEADGLKGQTGSEFDHSYIAAQLKDHQDVLDLLDNKMIPVATDPGLKAALQATRGMVVDHINMAKEVLATLGNQ